MKRLPLASLMVISLAFICFAGASLAGNVTMSTYFPVPFGNFKKLAVGTSAGYFTGSDNDLIVEGRVGIGTSAPTGKLVIKGTGAGPTQGLQVQDFNGNPLVTTLDNGNVLIGTTSPNAILTVRSVAGQAPVSFGTTLSTAATVDALGNLRIEKSLYVGNNETGQIFMPRNTPRGIVAEYNDPMYAQNFGLEQIPAHGGPSPRFAALRVFTCDEALGGIKCEIALGKYTDATTFTEWMTMTPPGNIGVGTFSPAASLDVIGTMKMSSDSTFSVTGGTTTSVNGTLNITSSAGTTALTTAAATTTGYGGPLNNSTFLIINKAVNIWGHTLSGSDQLSLILRGDVLAVGIYHASDERLKMNIRPIHDTRRKIRAINGVTFAFKADPEKKKIGLIAQNVEKAVPEVVSTDVRGIKSLEYSSLVGLLIESIKDQQRQIDVLKAQLKALEGR